MNSWSSSEFHKSSLLYIAKYVYVKIGKIGVVYKVHKRSFYELCLIKSLMTAATNGIVNIIRKIIKINNMLKNEQIQMVYLQSILVH